MSRNRNKSNELLRRAVAAMPLGVSSNFRYWGDESTIYVDRASGSHIWDVDGNRYIDYRLAFGPVILGHAHEEVDRHVAGVVKKGIVFALTSEREVSMAELMKKLVPGLERVRFANSGTEATMHAVRVARAYTGRDKIIKFEGQYHGMYDYVLWSTYPPDASVMGSKENPFPYAASSGIPTPLQGLTITLPYNDFDLLERCFQENGSEVACILVEPILGNCASIEPEPGYLARIRSLCDQYGVVLLLDEVKTGFRVALGGAQELYGIQADLVTFAKSMGNGYPVAAFGGAAEIMDVVGKGVAHGGTYAGNAVGMAAAEKTLQILSSTDALDRVADHGRQLMRGITDVLEGHDIPFVITGHPSMFGIVFAKDQPKDLRDWLGSDHGFYERLATALMDRGVMPDLDPREPWFVSAAHTKVDASETISAFEEAVGEIVT